MKIGLEVHVALPTKTKLFCSCSTEASEPNTSICPICMGLPGAKPMLNEKALEVGASIAKALNCKTQDTTSFVRKVYFYPDLPKSFQITQTEDAIGREGYLGIDSKKVGIRRIQLEEDPAKIIREEDYTLLDFNRSGVPLVEIVTEPDISSEEELREFLTELKSILYYLGVDIEKEFKVDLNISLGRNRVEIKNITGVKNIIDAERYEVERQGKLLKAGQEIAAETRSYNEAKMSTEASREKESEEEYGFIYEPDLTTYSTKGIELAKPVFASRLAGEYAARYNVSAKTLKELVLFNKDALSMIEHAKEKHDMKSIIASVELLSKYNMLDMKKERLERLLLAVEKGVYPDKETLSKLYKGEQVEAAGDAVDNKTIDKEIREVIKKNPSILEEYKKNPKAANFIVGQITKKYKVHPRMVSERLNEILSG